MEGAFEMKKIRVTVWNEFRHEKTEEAVRAIYPDGIHTAIGQAILECDDVEVTYATLDEPEQGLPAEVLDNTDVLVWWGHMAHAEVDDGLVERIRQRVYAGKMGFIALHSAHHSKPFKAIVGTTGNLSWGQEMQELVWNLCPTHAIAAGIPDHFELHEEMYGEPFYIPTPDDLVFGAWFRHGNILRCGCTFRRGGGKIFYFQPGHETCSSYYNPYVRRILQNAVHWASPLDMGYEIPGDYVCQWIPLLP